MNLGKLIQKGNELSISRSANVYEYSANNTILYTNDSSFSGYTIGWVCAYRNDDGDMATVELAFTSTYMILPSDVFKNDGHIYISMYAVKSKNIETTNAVEVYVDKSNSLTVTNNPTSASAAAIATALVNATISSWANGLSDNTIMIYDSTNKLIKNVSGNTVLDLTKLVYLG